MAKANFSTLLGTRNLKMLGLSAVAASLVIAGCGKEEPTATAQQQSQQAATQQAQQQTKQAEEQGQSTTGSGELDLAQGKAIYDKACKLCHDMGVAGAPKLGDQAAWGERLGQGMDTLFDHAINGLNAMPPRGGNASLSDEEVKSAVAYMVEQAK